MPGARELFLPQRGGFSSCDWLIDKAQMTFGGVRWMLAGFVCAPLFLFPAFAGASHRPRQLTRRRLQSHAAGTERAIGPAGVRGPVLRALWYRVSCNPAPRPEGISASRRFLTPMIHWDPNTRPRRADGRLSTQSVRRQLADQHFGWAERSSGLGMKRHDTAFTRPPLSSLPPPP